MFIVRAFWATLSSVLTVEYSDAEIAVRDFSPPEGYDGM
jgi:hypothetical protein